MLERRGNRVGTFTSTAWRYSQGNNTGPGVPPTLMTNLHQKNRCQESDPGHRSELTDPIAASSDREETKFLALLFEVAYYSTDIASPLGTLHQTDPRGKANLPSGCSSTPHNVIRHQK